MDDGRRIRQSSHGAMSLETFEGLRALWLDSTACLRWNCLFVLPPWLETWWRVFGPKGELCLCCVKEGTVVIGVAPLMVEGERASFIGSHDVCDYLDFAVSPGREDDFSRILLDDLIRMGVRTLDLGPLRPDSVAMTHFLKKARGRGYDTSCARDDVSLELDLPPTWEAYLGLLGQKQRHEVRRKLRRLGEVGRFSYRVIETHGDDTETLGVFLELFRRSKAEKTEFMSAQRESFFRSLARAMAEVEILRLGVLELKTHVVAGVMCFDDGHRVYLYNSGYDPEYASLSVGWACKVLSIKDSIERGRKTYDLLKGAEGYKYRLGGREIPLYTCRMLIK